MTLDTRQSILQIDLNMRNRTTQDYQGPAVTSRIQTPLEAALHDEDDINIFGSMFISEFSKKKSSSRLNGIKIGWDQNRQKNKNTPPQAGWYYSKC